MNQQNRFRYRQNKENNSIQSEINGLSILGPIGQSELSFNTLLDGATGATGPVGPPGSQGPQGPQGLRGNTGNTGSQGRTGVQGVTGPQGRTGVQGVTGPQGRTGVQGVIGPQGRTGVQGVQGRTGVQGVTGSQGRTGVQGVTGPQGRTGVQGLVGITGPLGNTGPQGLVGLVGATGPSGGPQGPTGPAGGPPGAQGPQGLKGGTGATGQGITINLLPLNTPLVTNNTIFETTGLTLSKASFRDVFRTIQGLTNSGSNLTDQDQFLINKYNITTYEPYRTNFSDIRNAVIFSDTYATFHLGNSYDATQYQLEKTFNAFIGSGPYYFPSMNELDPSYNIGRYFNHVYQGNIGIEIEMTVRCNNGGTASANLRDDITLYLEKGNNSVSQLILGSQSTNNSTNSVHEIKLFMFQDNNNTVNLVVNRITRVGTTTQLIDPVYYSLVISDLDPEYGGKIRIYFNNGLTNTSKILNWKMTGYAWMAAPNTTIG